jgi:hypothetical protein
MNQDKEEQSGPQELEGSASASLPPALLAPRVYVDP